MNAFPYRDVFDAVEARLIEMGSRQMDSDSVRAQLNKFKRFAGRDLTDDQYFSILVFVAFYSGFRAATVTSKREIIKGHFSDLGKVAAYTERDIKRILTDPDMIRHEGEIRGCVTNAQTLGAFVAKHGSLKNFIASYSPDESFENLMLLKETLEASFAYLGGITVYHFMTDIGLPVLEPDRVMCRIFERLGLLENEGQLLKAVLQGRKFAEATDLPIRYIDIVFVAYGQVKSEEIGVAEGICLKKPRCRECGIREHCKYPTGAIAMPSLPKIP